MTRQTTANHTAVTAEQRRLFIEQAPAAIAMLDRGIRYLACSAKWAMDYKLDPTRIIGRSHYDLFPEIPDHWKQVHKRALSGEFLARDEELFVRANGEPMWLRWDVRPWYQPNGTIGGILIYSEDITRQKTAEIEALKVQSSLEAALASMRDAVFICDVEGRFVHINDAFSKFHRFKSKAECPLTYEPYGRLFEVRLPNGEPVPNDQRPVPRALRGESETDVEFNLRRTDTGETWVASYSFAPIRDGDHQITGAVVTGRDITEQQLASKRQHESEARLSAIVDNALEGIIVIDRAGIIQSANRAVEGLFHYRQEELVGQNIKILMAEPHHSQHDEYLASYQRTGVRKIIGIGRIVEGRRKDGSVFPLDLSVAEWWDKDGKRFFTGMLRDVTERLRIEAELANARRFETAGQLAAGVTHDFNNLLAVIAGNLELAERKVEDPEARQLLRRAYDAAEIGGGLNRRLLSMTRTRPLVPERLLLNTRVEGTMGLLSRMLGSNIELKSSMAPDLWETIIDSGEIDSALLNLALNARDALPNGGHIAVSTSNVSLDTARAATMSRDALAGDYVRVEVADDGVGMSTEVLRRALEPFFTTKGASKGVGIGLSSVERFVRQSGGFLTLSSKPGQGTTVSLYLPRAPDLAASRAVAAPADIPMGDGELVLVVEDDEQVREVTLRRVEALGYSVIDARTGQEAVARLQSGEPIRIVLTDVVMPGSMTGYDVAQWVASHSSRIKVILSSAYNDAELAQTRPGAYRDIKILRKPYSRMQLAEALRDSLD